MTNWSFEDKLLWTRQVILRSLKSNKIPAVSCSWGKDSVVMVDLVRRFCSRAYIIFANTNCEYPETYKYRDDMLKTYFQGLNYQETKPLKSFWECVKQYGFPKFRQNFSMRKKGSRGASSPLCCFFLKERPLAIRHRELKVDNVFIGLQATESMNRRLLFLRMGEYYFNKKRKTWITLPLIIWKDEDVFQYLEKYKIPLNPIYQQMKRNGCMFCTGFKTWREVMAKYHPKIYEYVSHNYDGQTLINQECFQGAE